MNIRSLALIATMSLASCATSPEPGYYTLAATPGAVMPEVATAIKIQRPALAGYLDRPDFVAQQNNFKVDVDESEHWAEPLDRMFARVLAEDMRQRLPASQVGVEGDTLAVSPRFVVDINIEHFNAIEKGDVLLEGDIVVKDTNSGVMPQFIPIKFTTGTSSSAQSVVEGLSELVGLAADNLGQVIETQLSNTP